MLLRKAPSLTQLMLKDTCHKETSHPDVEDTALAGHDVDVVAFLAQEREQQIPQRACAASE
ncbi:MAG: hypothetical protein JWO91_1593 [Acidobacteriaceae bacterium]|nr:hypothetical protein [Acidobacteriaceae bacterium]